MVTHSICLDVEILKSIHNILFLLTNKNFLYALYLLLIFVSGAITIYFSHIGGYS